MEARDLIINNFWKEEIMTIHFKEAKRCFSEQKISTLLPNTSLTRNFSGLWKHVFRHKNSLRQTALPHHPFPGMPSL